MSGSVLILELPSLVVLRILPAPIKLVYVLFRLSFYQGHKKIKTLAKLAYAS